MNKIFIRAALAILLVLCAIFTVSCAADKPSGNGLSIVCVNFPAYDFARAVAGDGNDISILLPPGSESHSYEPSAKDIIKISECNLFICTGGENDAWVDSILDSLDTKPAVLRMTDCVTLLDEETVEGMEAESYDGGSSEPDEHVWTAPANAADIVAAIRDKLCELFADNAESYKTNADAYLSQLDALDDDFKQLFDSAGEVTLVFGDRFPFRYFVEEYGIKYYAAFPGCSSETEPSAATIAFLIDKIKEKSLGAVFYTEFSNHLVADSIAESTGAKSLMLHSCHNVTQEQLANGDTYVSLMRDNLETLKSVLLPDSAS